MIPLRILLYEGTGSIPFSSMARFQILKALLEKGYTVSCTQGRGQVAPAGGSALLVLGCFTDGKITEAQSASPETPVYFRNVENLQCEAILDLVETTRSEFQAIKPGEWKPWFPVIDYSRCTNCMQCLSFCLFDVYGVSVEKTIQVQNPQNCKTDCPACSRVCPEVAILFPKYKSGPINGDEISEDDLRREKMKIDISALLGGDIYATLRDRSKRAQSRFAKERDDERALKERQRCLAKIKDELGIPAEALMSLPTLEEIEAKAEKALVAAKGVEGVRS